MPAGSHRVQVHGARLPYSVYFTYLFQYEDSILKRAFDGILAAALLLLLAPVLALLALQIRRKLGAPVLFRQSRIGLNDVQFTLIKFRSMTDQLDMAGELLPDDQRLSPYGLWLRRTSLDELPTLWNVLCGQMSLVGPRPLLVQYLPLYSTVQRRRHEVRPGITGWAQVNGRNNLSWDEKFELDVWYVDNRSAQLDLQIIVKTVVKVLRREDISAEGNATMPVFTGSENSAAKKHV